MQIKNFVLGIDTSNYTTSLAVTDKNGSIVIDSRKSLTVKQGERGLRQSHALFQHMENIPDMLPELFGKIDKSRIGAVAASGRPRPVEGSYMPVFKAGVNYGKVMAAALGVPFFEFSHQEGHLEAALHGSGFSGDEEYLAYHLSGGTCELLHVTPSSEGLKNRHIRILGGSRDLSFGQVLDRIGVTLGMEFPAGREMDRIASEMNRIATESRDKPSDLLKEIPIDGLEINLSGIETQCRRELEKGADREALIFELFQKISRCLCSLTKKAAAETGCGRVLFTGGVSASQFVREEIGRHFGMISTNPEKKPETNLQPVFGDPALASDNAVGVALLGGKALWQSNQ
ncbi:MAG TPA: hypothetical protein VN381_10660 [Anaerovoracaceae bacterium]|nr:hypothetical protein [Anaerovoracaceae bacterium]